MTYKIQFIPSALKEWNQLDNSIKLQFKKVLEKRLNNPKILSAQLRNQPIECYKIKLRTSGYRLIYTIEEKNYIIMILIIKKRDEIYPLLSKLIKKS